MPTSTRSGATDRSPQASDVNALALRTRGTAKITRTREIIDKVVVEHLGTPPVTTTAEQQVVKRTTMERGKRNGQALEPPASKDSGSKRRQTSSVHTGSAAEAPSVAAPAAPTEVPIEADAQEEHQGARGEEDPMMSTQDYMAEAEELLANPMDTQDLEDVPAEGAPQAAGGETGFDAAAAALHEEAAAAQEAEAADEEAAGEPPLVAPVIIEATEVVVEEPMVEEPEEAAPAAEEPAAAATPTPPVSSGGAGIFGSVAQVLQRVLHPSAGAHRNGTGAEQSEEEPAGMVEQSMESEGPSAPQEEAAAEEPAEEAQEKPPQKKRRGRPPAKSKKSKDTDAATPADVPTRADPSIAAVSPDAAGEPPAPEAVAASLPEPGAASPQQGGGPAKKGGRKGKQEAPAEAQEEEPEDEATEEASEPPKTKGRGRPAKKQQPAKKVIASSAFKHEGVQVPEVPEEEEEEAEDTETTPTRVFPPETHVDVPAPRTPAKRAKHPSKPATEPATKRRKGRTPDYTVEEPEEEEHDEEEEDEPEEQVRVSPRSKSAAADKEPARASPRGRAAPEALKTPAAAPSKAAAAKPAPSKAAPAKAAPARKAPAKVPPRKSVPATEPAPAKGRGARGRPTQGGKQPAKKSGGVGPKPRKMRRNENYKSYILKVLKEIHPDESISKKAMDIMDAFSADMFNRITLEAARLCRHTNKQTMTSREVETAVRLLLPGELGKHALSEGRKAVVQGLS